MKPYILFLLTILSISAKAQDSIVQVVFNALTVETPNVEKPVLELLADHNWEALAYWDTEVEKSKDFMFEAVGDVYVFKANHDFELHFKDPNDGNAFGLNIKGTFKVVGNNIELLSNKNKTLIWKIIWLDQNYLILEVDGLRIFYTQSKTYFDFN